MKELISRAGAFALAAVAGIGITILGEGVWGALAVVNVRTSPQIPWSVGVMAALLAVLIAYLGGSGWPRSNAAERRRLLRWNPVKPSAFRWAILAGLLALAALGGAWIALSDVVHIPAGATPSLRGVPLWSQVALVIMGSLAAPLTEEAAFRGYAMGILERGWKSPWAALIVSSALFAGMHYTQGIDATKLSLYFTVGLILGGVALLTNSLYPAMIVHGLGDVMGFTLLWPHDAPHTLVTQGGRDPLFVPAVATLAICLPASLVAFARLARMTRGGTQTRGKSAQGPAPAGHASA